MDNKLVAQWNMIRKQPHTWDSFEDFKTWAKKNGFQNGKKLVFKSSGIAGPDTCQWVTPKPVKPIEIEKPKITSTLTSTSSNELPFGLPLIKGA